MNSFSSLKKIIKSVPFKQQKAEKSLGKQPTKKSKNTAKIANIYISRRYIWEPIPEEHSPAAVVQSLDGVLLILVGRGEYALQWDILLGGITDTLLMFEEYFPVAY